MKIAPAYGQKPPKKTRSRLGLGVLAALIVSLFGAKNATRHGAPTPSLEPRAARAEDVERGEIAAVKYALVTSLWADYAVPSCRVATVYANTAKGASLGPVMRLSMKSPVRTPAAAVHAATWVAREMINLEAANDADIASRYVSMEPGAAPTVRIFRAARIKPRRAQFSAEKFAGGSGLRMAA